jgi:ribose transport system substrate-binding protein
MGAADTAKAYLSAHPELVGMYAGNSMTSEGMVAGVRELGRAGRITLIGYDSNNALKAAIRDGSLLGCVLQSPYAMGYESCKAGLEYIFNKVTPAGPWFKDSGVLFMNKANIDSPEAVLITKEW